MEDSQPSHVETRAVELDAAGARAERLKRTQLAGGARIKAAVSFYNSMGNEETSAIGIRAACLKAMPRAVRVLISIATGKRKGAPAVAILKAIEMVAGGAGHSFEAAPGAGGSKPLAEMTLAELDQALGSMQDSVRNLQAIEGSAVSLPHQGSNAPPTEPEPPA